MPCGAVPFIACHLYDLHGSVLLSPQRSPAAGNSSELLPVPNAMYRIGGESGRNWVGCPVRVGLRWPGRHGEIGMRYSCPTRTGVVYVC